ncbi:MAG TPA: (d)CMP kinase [Erysipelothrix sp.]
MFNIAIDGPSASGKSSIAKALAKKLNFTHIDTGAMYRAVGLACMQEGISLDNEKLCSQMARDIKIELTADGKIYLENEDVSDLIRHDKVGKAASMVSQYQEVRENMVRLQRKMAAKKGYVMDGRDITSVVLPDAEIKIFQTADAKVRAQRRYQEFINQGLSVDFDDIYQDLLERDERDKNRSESPLIKVDDAIEIDTTYLSIDEVVALVLNLIESRNLV